MQPVLFYGVPQWCSFGSIVALEWLGQPYRLCRIRMPEEVQSERYARVNRIRETPSLMLEDGRVISQSMAILLNIAARGASQRVWAPGVAQFDRIAEALAFLNTSFFSAFSPLWRAYEAQAEPPVQEVLRQTGRDEVRKAHAQLESLLSDREWLAGDERSVADAYFIGVARWSRYHQALDQSEFPNVHRLVRRLEADPAVLFAHAIEDERPARSAGGFRGHVELEALLSRLAA
jgi:glutathione S-transferase